MPCRSCCPCLGVAHHHPSPPHAETNFKTQVEADIQPFRGILLGLFFVTTGSSLDVRWALLCCGAASLCTLTLGQVFASKPGTGQLPALRPSPTPLHPRVPPIHPRSLLVQQWPLVLTLLAGLLATKIAIISALGPLFGLSKAESVRTGFILSQVCTGAGCC